MSMFAAVARRDPTIWRLTTRLKRFVRPNEREMALLPQLVARNRVAVDVGANMGNYTAAFADLAAGVVAFEPNPAMAADLRRLLPRKVRVIEAAASDRRGSIELRIPDNGSGRATIEAANDLAGHRYETIQVPMVMLDDIDLGDVGFLKVDVEGHELAVLKGTIETLKRCRPVILVEAVDEHRPDAVKSVTDFLSGLDYVGLVFQDGALVPMAQRRGADIFNYIFQPTQA